jgi:thermitase
MGLAALAFSAVSFAAAADSYVPHRLLVKFADGTTPSMAQQVLSSVSGRIDRDLPDLGIKIVSLPANAAEAAAANALLHRPGVEFAELDKIHRPEAIQPNDPYYMYGWHLSKIGAPAAWLTSTGSSSVIIAILDTGCDPTHPDLLSKYVPGWNIYGNNSDSSDVYGHGTTVAGSAAASSDNGAGVASIAWQCKLMPIRVSDVNGNATDSAIASGLSWAANHGARVANVSYQVTASATVKTAAQSFQSKGGVVTVSAGNYATQDTNADNPYELTVSATDSTDALATFSNYGSDVDIAAPGQGIWTTVRGGGYSSASGTSYSAPIVAAAAAMVLSVNPSLSGAQVQNVLKSSADDLGAAGWDPRYGYGRLNLDRALSLALGTSGNLDTSAPSVSFLQPSAGLVLQGNFTVAAQASDNAGIASLAISIDGTQVASAAAGSCNYGWNTAGAPNGSHQLLALATDTSGNVSTFSITVDVENPLDTTAPVVAITSPNTGARVGNSLSVSASASDNVRVTKVELWVDGKLALTSTTAPWAFSVNSRKWTPGSHGLVCKAYDAAGNCSSSASVSVQK